MAVKTAHGRGSRISDPEETREVLHTLLDEVIDLLQAQNRMN